MGSTRNPPYACILNTAVFSAKGMQKKPREQSRKDDKPRGDARSSDVSLWKANNKRRREKNLRASR